MTAPRKDDDPATMTQTSTPNDNPSIYDLIEADLRAREQVGIEKYGTTLQGGNGRRSLVDAYQEALDLVCYLKCELETRRLDYERGFEAGQTRMAGKVADYRPNDEREDGEPPF